MGILLGLSVANGRADITEGLVAYYPFEGDATDASGRGHHGTATAVTYEPGVLGSAAFFNGTSGFVEVPNHSDFRLQQADNKTFVFWMRCVDSSLRNACILSKYTSGNSGLGLQFAFTKRGEPVHGYPYLYLHLQSSQHMDFAPTVSPVTWSCIALVKSGSSWYVYENGKRIGGVFTFGNAEADTPFRIGGNAFDNQPFPGWIDELRIYNRVLSQAEVQEVQAFATGSVGIVTQPQNRSGCPGQSVTFSVTARGQEPVSYQWYHGAAPIAGATAATLVLDALEAADAGTYSVVVTNALHSVTSRAATLTMFDACAELRMYAGLNITGEVGRTYVVKYTTDVDNTDFATWTPLATNTLSSPTWFFVDVQSPAAPKRYYGVAVRP